MESSITRKINTLHVPAPLQLDLAASPSSLINIIYTQKTAKLMVLINICAYLLWVKPTTRVVVMDNKCNIKISKL